MIDTHAHLYLCKESPDMLVAMARAAGVQAIVNVATDLASAHMVLAQSEQYPGYVYPTVGIHPCTPLQPDEVLAVSAFLDQYRHQVVAIGEIGLDLYRETLPLADQLYRFEQQLDLARVYALPVIIHSRQADAPMLDVILRYPDVRKVFHCFSSGSDFVEQVQHPNVYFSFTGHITYDNPHIVAAMSRMRTDQVMIETDCPYLTPKPLRGQANHPGNVPLVNEALALCFGLSGSEMARMTTRNAQRFFGIQVR